MDSCTRRRICDFRRNDPPWADRLLSGGWGVVVSGGGGQGGMDSCLRRNDGWGDVS